MKLKLFLPVIFLLMTDFCESQSKNYTKLKNVYSDLIEAWKTKDDETLKRFCYNLVVNEETKDYMEDNYLCYRGFPCEMENKKASLEEVKKNLFQTFYPKLKNIRYQLISDGILESIVHVDSTSYDFASQMVVIINQKKIGNDDLIYQYKRELSIKDYDEILRKSDSLNKPMSDLLIETKNNYDYEIHKMKMTFGMLFKSNSKVYAYVIGEMIQLNGKWFLFSTPREEYNVIENH